MALPAVLRAHLRPAAVQWLATLYAALVSLGISILLARRMGPEAFGTYSYVVGIVALLAPLQNAGFSTLLLREKISATPALAALAPALPGLALGHLLAVSLAMMFGAVLLLPFPDAVRLSCGIFCFRELRLVWLDTDALHQLSGKLLIAAPALGILLAGGGYFAAPIAVRLLFGASYAEVSAETARCLFLSFAFVVPNAVLTQLAIATNRERCYAWAACYMALLNISLNFALVPAHGILGAAWATITTEAGLGLALYIGMIRRKNFSGPPA